MKICTIAYIHTYIPVNDKKKQNNNDTVSTISSETKKKRRKDLKAVKIKGNEKVIGRYFYYSTALMAKAISLSLQSSHRKILSLSSLNKCKKQERVACKTFKNNLKIEFFNEQTLKRLYMELK